jgi:hypothetical protein
MRRAGKYQRGFEGILSMRPREVAGRFDRTAVPAAPSRTAFGRPHITPIASPASRRVLDGARGQGATGRSRPAREAMKRRDGMGRFRDRAREQLEILGRLRGFFGSVDVDVEVQDVFARAK